MRRSLTLAVAGALAFSAVAAHGVDHNHPCYDAATGSLAYAEQDVFFHRGEAPVANGGAANPWSTDAPASSVQGGAGALAVTPGFAGLADGTGAEQAATFTGTFDGCLDTMVVDLYSFDMTNRSGSSGSAQPAQHDFGYTLTVDGVQIASAGPVEALTTFDNEGFGPNLNQFAINIGELMELYTDFGITLDGEHTIELSVASWYVNTGHAVYVWDTTEVPSGISFNGAVPEGVPVVG